MGEQSNNTNNQTNSTQVTITSKQANNNSTTKGTATQPSPNWQRTEEICDQSIFTMQSILKIDKNNSDYIDAKRNK